MNFAKVRQRPIPLPSSQKRGLRTQFGALCYRVQKGNIQVLLITSRGSKRWIVPKGWPMDGATPAKTAEREAFEEAGVEGKVTGNCIGIYSYTKDMGADEDLHCMVALFPIKVQKLHAVFPEYKERRRRWFSLKKAAKALGEPELSQIVKSFNPKIGPGRI